MQNPRARSCKQVGFLGVLVFCGAVPACAQVRELSSATLQAKCQHYASIVQSGLPADSLRFAVGVLDECGVSGPPVLSVRWSSPIGDPDLQQSLVAASRILRDGRVLSAVAAVASSSSAPRDMRLRALEVLATYADATAAPTFTDAVIAETASLPGDPTPRHEPSTQPFNGQSTTTIATALLAASADGDPAVRAAARRVRQHLAFAAPLAAPPQAGSLTLTYICGNRFRMRNSGDIGIRYRYDVYGTAEAKQLWVDHPAAGEPYVETFFTTTRRGTVRVFVGSRLVQTKANGGSACPG